MGTTSSTVGGDHVCAFITSLRWGDVPAGVRERVVMAATDTLAAMVAGAPARSTRIATDVALATFAPGRASLVADHRRLTAEGAAFVNAVAANAYDLDDVSVHTWGHPGAQVFPAALALAEEAEATGEELATAVLIGYEVACRQALCLYADVPAAAERDYRGCGAWGAVAAAAVAARLLRLSTEQTWQALGIAEYHAPDAQILRDVRAPGMVKHGHGPAVLAGIMAARLARKGFTGTTGLLGEERFAAMIGDVGERYLVEGRGIEWKDHACCWWAHPPLFALRALLDRQEATDSTGRSRRADRPPRAGTMNRGGRAGQMGWEDRVGREGIPFDPAEIERIIVEAHHDSHLLGARLPTTTEEAQFSVAWPLAAFLLDGEVGVVQIDERRMSDPVLRELAERVELRRSDELDRLYFLADANDPAGREAARVVIELKDGRRLDSGIVALPQHEDPWTLDDVRAKFRRATRHVLSDQATEALLAAAERLPHLAEAGELTRHFASLEGASLTVGGGTGSRP